MDFLLLISLDILMDCEFFSAEGVVTKLEALRDCLNWLLDISASDGTRLSLLGFLAYLCISLRTLELAETV